MKLTPPQNRMLNAIRAAGSQGLIVNKSDQPAIRVGNKLAQIRLVNRERIEAGWLYTNR